MNKYLWPLAAMGIILLVGVTLIISPFMGDGGAAAPVWTDATRNTFWTGIGVVVVALLGVWSAIRGLRQQLMRRHLLPHKATESTPRRALAQTDIATKRPLSKGPSGDGISSDTDQLLRSLAESVLRDLVHQVPPPDRQPQEDR